MTIHRAARSFDRVPDVYERGRPEYPAAVVDIIAAALGMTRSSTVVDLAAGTGKLTRLLAAAGARVVAIEPAGGMRAALEAVVPEAEVREGTAEHMPLDDDSADVVTVAQAFHWFAAESALAEIQRVLRPDGGLALVWSRRDTAQPIQRAIEALIAPYRQDAPRQAAGAWRPVIAASERFTPVGEWHVPQRQTVDVDRLVDRVMSISFIASLPDSERARVRERTRALSREMPASFDLDYISDVYCYRVVKGITTPP